MNKRYRGKNIDNKYMIPIVEYICFESDSIPLKEQIKILDKLKPYIKTAIYSGGKSIHMWLKTNVITYNSPSKSIANNPVELEYIKNTIRSILASLGYSKDDYDNKVLNDYSTWLRLPYCTRKNKANTRIIYHNSNPDNIVFDNTDSIYEYEEDIDDLQEHYNGFSEPKEHDSLSNPFTVIIDSGTFEPDLAQINHSHLKSIPNFFDNLDRYFKYKIKGLDSKNTRRLMYKDVLIANRILMGFDRYFIDKIVDKKQEKKQDNSSNPFTVIIDSGTFKPFQEIKRRYMEDIVAIIEISSGRYNCTYDEAIQDALKYFDKSRLINIPIQMPNLTKIGILEELNDVKDKLETIGIKESKNIARLLYKLLIAKIKLLPYKCLKGNLGLHMNNEIRQHINNKRTKAVMQELNANNILIKTQDSKNSKRTTRYWVNVPLVLWATTKANKLYWGKF
jgi:hypothetical protein